MAQMHAGGSEWCEWAHRHYGAQPFVTWGKLNGGLLRDRMLFKVGCTFVNSARLRAPPAAPPASLIHDLSRLATTLLVQSSSN